MSSSFLCIVVPCGHVEMSPKYPGNLYCKKAYTSWKTKKIKQSLYLETETSTVYTKLLNCLELLRKTVAFGKSISDICVCGC